MLEVECRQYQEVISLENSFEESEDNTLYSLTQTPTSLETKSLYQRYQEKIDCLCQEANQLSDKSIIVKMAGLFLCIGGWMLPFIAVCPPLFLVSLFIFTPVGLALAFCDVDREVIYDDIIQKLKTEIFLPEKLKITRKDESITHKIMKKSAGECWTVKKVNNEKRSMLQCPIGQKIYLFPDGKENLDKLTLQEAENIFKEKIDLYERHPIGERKANYKQLTNYLKALRKAVYLQNQIDIETSPENKNLCKKALQQLEVNDLCHMAKPLSRKLAQATKNLYSIGKIFLYGSYISGGCIVLSMFIPCIFTALLSSASLIFLGISLIFCVYFLFRIARIEAKKAQNIELYDDLIDQIKAQADFLGINLDSNNQKQDMIHLKLKDDGDLLTLSIGETTQRILTLTVAGKEYRFPDGKDNLLKLKKDDLPQVAAATAEGEKYFVSYKDLDEKFEENYQQLIACLEALKKFGQEYAFESQDHSLTQTLSLVAI